MQKALSFVEKFFPVIAVVLMLGLIVYGENFSIHMYEIGLGALALILFGAALWRPGLLFGLFVAMIPLENINLASDSLGMQIRPYQLLGGILLLALGARALIPKYREKTLSLRWFDWGLIIFALSSVLTASLSANMMENMKLAVIALSFVSFYFIVRFFVRSRQDMIQVMPYGIGSYIIVMLYGIWQNWAFIHRGYMGEMMPGRPNATFFEPDWFAAYAVFGIGSLLGMLYVFLQKKELFKRDLYAVLVLYEALILGSIALIISVARSSWLAGIVVLGGFFGLIILQEKRALFFLQLKKARDLAYRFIFLGGLVALFVWGFQLTNFELGNRIQSTSSGLQEITVACDRGVSLPEKIVNVEELDQYQCMHIDLEQIATLENEGVFITKIYRTDPNVDIRKNTWNASLDLIRENLLFGVGFASIGEHLGTDEQGTQLNTSNIFLEIWLGSGLVGFVAFVSVLGWLVWKNIQVFLVQKGRDVQYFAGGSLLVFSAVIIPNMFNAGQFLGFFWLWLGVSVSMLIWHEDRKETSTGKLS